MNKLKQPRNIRKISIDASTLEKLKNSSEEEAQTIVHCRYISKTKYINGGWVNIYPTTYLVNGEERITLLYADNIPMAPACHQFSHPGELKWFTLIFPAIPKDWKQFNLIEECGAHTGFTVSNIRRNNQGVYEVFLC